MSNFSTTVLVKLTLLGFLSFALLLSVSSLYIGPRYGKRLPYDTTRVALRSSSPRTIQSRSQVRFYAGSRYGGKRSNWETAMPESERRGYADFLQQQAGNNSPYDCFYTYPYVGIRCLSRHNLESTWNSVGENDEDSGSPNNDALTGNPSISVGETESS